MIKENYSTLTPAYGRDYKSKAAAIADFNGNKDFVLNTPWGTGLVSKIDFAPGVTVNIRYKKLTQVAVVRV